MSAHEAGKGPGRRAGADDAAYREGHDRIDWGAKGKTRDIRNSKGELVAIARSPAPEYQAVRVCPERDIECGERQASWCETCPKREATTDWSAA